MADREGEGQLVGKWISDPEDYEAIKEYGNVSLEFSEGGRLAYTVHGEGKRQIMLLTYRVEQDILITNQPSDAREERTRFEINPSGKLVLLYEQRPSTYIWSADAPVFPLAVNLN